MISSPSRSRGAATPVLSAQGLAFAPQGQPVAGGLSFDILPGLTLVRGGDGRGKTTLLRLLAGTLTPTAGVLLRPAGLATWFRDPTAAVDDAVPASHWLAQQRPGFPAWRADIEQALIDAFALTPHRDKPLYMLSSGSRRKVGLVGAAASGAVLTLVDTPFAALDGPSRRVLADLLAEAAEGDRAWVVADYERPPALDGVDLAGIVDLGD